MKSSCRPRNIIDVICHSNQQQAVFEELIKVVPSQNTLTCYIRFDHIHSYMRSCSRDVELWHQNISDKGHCAGEWRKHIVGAYIVFNVNFPLQMTGKMLASGMANKAISVLLNYLIILFFSKIRKTECSVFMSKKQRNSG